MNLFQVGVFAPYDRVQLQVVGGNGIGRVRGVHPRHPAAVAVAVAAAAEQPAHD